MNDRKSRRIWTRGAFLAASLLSLSAGAGLRAQSHDDSDAPVKRELEAFKKKSNAEAPSERVKAYEQGIDAVRKSGAVEKALKVGDRAPDFELPDALGKPVKLSALLKDGPVVLTWYRGGWCPYCNIQLRGLQRALPAFKEAGATLVALSPQTPDNSLSTVEKNKLDFVVLSDKGNAAARGFGIAYKLPKEVAEAFRGRLDLAKVNGDDSLELPLAATYVIDAHGVVRWAFVDADYRKRAEPSDVVRALEQLKK